MGYYDGPRDNPERHGLQIIADVEWSSGSYEFDQTVVWQHLETGQLYIASDSGCSCPSPFESYDSIADLDKTTVHGALTELRDRFEKIEPGTYHHDCVAADYMAACTALMWLKD